MKKVIQGAMMLAAAAVTLTMTAAGQQLPGAAPAPAAGPPAEEMQALQKILGAQVQNIQDVDNRIKAIDGFVQKYPKSVLRTYALEQAGEANLMKNDSTKALFYYEEALKADPTYYPAMVVIAKVTAQTTPEFDIKKEDKLGRAEKLANDALKLIPDAPKPGPQVTDAQWDGAKKDDIASAHEALGMIAMTRKNFTASASEFQLAINTGVTPQPNFYVRLGGALNEAGKYDEAITVLNKVLAMQGLPDVTKKVAEDEKKRGEQLKNAKK